MQWFNKLKERIKENFKKNKVLLIIVAIVWVITIIVTLNVYKTTIGKKSIGKQNCETVVELYEGSLVTQQMTSVDDAESIAVKLATYARSNSGNVFIKVVGDQSGTVYLDTSFKTSTVQDNAFKTLELKERINKNKDQSITLSLTSDSKEGSSIGVYYGAEYKEFGVVDEDTGEERFSVLTINGEVTDYEMGFKYLLTDDNYIAFSKLVIICAIIGYTALILIVLIIKPKIEVLFSTIILVFGLIFMVIIVPLSPPDEQYHYESSLQISNKMMKVDNYLSINKRYVYYGNLFGHYNVSGGYTRLIEDFNEPLELSSSEVEISNDIAGVYSVCFVPQAIGVTVARFFKVNMLKTFYCGRLFNLIFYIVCIYFAIKNTPVYKMLFGILASLPMFIQIAASYSYDCFIVALCFLMASYLFKWYFKDETIKTKDFIVVFLCSLAVAPLKYVYGFIPLLYFFVPKKRFGNNLLLKIVGVCVLAAPGMSYLLPMIFERIFKNFGKLFETANIEINTSTNLLSTSNEIAKEEIEFNASYVFTHPLETIDIFYRTVRYSIKQWFYNSMGRALSGETLVLPITLVKIIAGLAIFTAFRKEEFVPSIPFKACSLALCAVIGLTIMMGMFLSWTPSKQEIIEDFGGLMIQGIQGRYFSPILPYAFMIFNNKKINWPKKFDKYVVLVLIFITFEVVMYVLSYTFVN